MPAFDDIKEFKFHYLDWINCLSYWYDLVCFGCMVYFDAFRNIRVIPFDMKFTKVVLPETKYTLRNHQPPSIHHTTIL